MSTTRYDAFISYSHDDVALAERLSRRIRNYRPPRATGLPRRRLTVFRDRERLTTSADLSKSLDETLGASAHLVLLASPPAARSAYVNQEVTAFLDRRGESHLSIVVCGGAPPDNLPPAVRARIREPLYIDLRTAQRRTFRLESLRLIAALLGVEYADLRREDELRRRRQRAFAIGAAVMLMAGAASAYLVTTTPAEAWEQVRQPETHAGPDPLMPIERVAINPRDPAVVVWLADNARYKRDLAGVRETWAPALDELGDWSGRVHTTLAGTSDLDAAVRPVATLMLEATSGQTPVGSGELRVYAMRDKERLLFGRSFRFSPATPGSRPVTLPLTVLEEGRGPFDLEPGPADAMRRAGFDTGTMTIRGVITDHTAGGTPATVDFFVSDNRADIREVLAATAGPEQIVFSTNNEVTTDLRDRLDASSGDELWAELVAGSGWIAYQPPTRAKPSSFARDATDARADARAAGLEAGLVDSLDPASLAGDLVSVERLTRTVGAARLSVTTLSGIVDHHEAVAAPQAAHYLHLEPQDRWIRMTLPVESRTTRVVDVAAADPQMRTLFAVSDREGVFRTLDGGATWHSANLGESRLRDGTRVRLIVAGSAVFAMAAIHSEPGSDPNPLFRLNHRNWFHRWRLGLARLLSR